MAPDELEMQIARAVLAEEHCREKDAVIDALVAALESEMARTKDEGLWPNPKAEAALALARKGG